MSATVSIANKGRGQLDAPRLGRHRPPARSTRQQRLVARGTVQHPTSCNRGSWIQLRHLTYVEHIVI